MRVTDKLLAIGLLTDKDLDQLLCLIDPASFDNGLYSGIMSVICTAVFVRRGTKKGKGKGKGSPYSITERRVPERIPVLGSQPAGDVSHKPGGMSPLLSARPAVAPATLKRTAISFAAW